ncbi:RBBP9/YdeN family alpha/beta hydrolase [Novosphingobium album (ex Liu et al. 2023)]|uniref:Alpha/beta hydrolase n=1 Tax=Novosphingobium album (ex Liu et al. 2023) TaxID=3031130 RepID=A0ABT5WWX0_9SPHN|nr:alpha/beta hydrolase [Novosphingobium album (ex Liu et al. 2023)]MDE8654379.1 alpha/beta hydrolase [Novosphingobium album (ex Liu et al. 2023)]
MAYNSKPAAASTRPAVLLVPGLSGSGENHWQTRWENELPDCRKVDLGLWEDPHRNTWINKLNLAIHRAGQPVVLVAHSLGCLLTAWWAKFEQPGWCDPVIGALLVAPPEADFFPLDERIARFAPTPCDALPFPSILVASRDDPWMGFNTAKALARRWNSEFVDAGERGHINADSGLGDWRFGQRLLDRLIGAASTRRETAAAMPPGHGDWAEGLEYRA